MLTLYGFDVSNYHNMVKYALEYKDLSYEVVTTYPNQSEAYLAISPMGKVPALQTEQGVLVETNVILEYLDTQYPAPPLYPSDPFECARVKELAKVIELYIELPARRCLSEAMWGMPVHENTKKEAKRSLLNGIQAFSRVAAFDPFVAGSQFTAADIMFLYTMGLANTVATKVFEFNIFDKLPQGKTLYKDLKQTPIAQKIDADTQAATPAFYEYLSKVAAKK